jgi:hypothetical protein
MRPLEAAVDRAEARLDALLHGDPTTRRVSREQVLLLFSGFEFTEAELGSISHQAARMFNDMVQATDSIEKAAQSCWLHGLLVGLMYRETPVKVSDDASQ